MPKDKRKRKPPPTWADVTAARNEGVDNAMTIVLTVLRDNFAFTDEETEAFMTRIAKLSAEIAEGRITVKDLKKVQLKEYMTLL